jgi:hypothetical protein
MTSWHAFQEERSKHYDNSSSRLQSDSSAWAAAAADAAAAVVAAGDAAVMASNDRERAELQELMQYWQVQDSEALSSSSSIVGDSTGNSGSAEVQRSDVTFDADSSTMMTGNGQQQQQVRQQQQPVQPAQHIDVDLQVIGSRFEVLVFNMILVTAAEVCCCVILAYLCGVCGLGCF